MLKIVYNQNHYIIIVPGMLLNVVPKKEINYILTIQIKYATIIIYGNYQYIKKTTKSINH